MEKKWLIVGGIVVGLLAVAFFVSPSRHAEEEFAERMVERAIEQGAGGNVDVEYDAESVSVETSEGSLQAGEDVTLPSGFPSDVYVFEGKLTAVLQTNEKAYTASIETDKPIAEVKKAYQDKMASDGWEIAGVMDFGGTASIMGKKDTRDMSVVLSADETGKTSIVVTVAENQ